MKTNKVLVMGMLAAAFMCSCSSEEEPATAGSLKAIQASAGIGQSSRAVIDADYGSDLNVSFVRMDHPEAGDAVWNSPSIDAVRTGGAGNTVLTFEPEQTYLTPDGETVLVGYYPRKAPDSGTTNPVNVSYTITGDDDIMATDVQTGSLVEKFKAFTFSHLLTQLQFKCTGSAGAISKWTSITSIKVKDVSTSLTLSLDKTDGASLAATGTADQVLAVANCPTVVSGTETADPKIGYLMLYPVADMGTATTAINLEVVATYEGGDKTLTVPITNISGGIKAGYSHLVTLTFTEDGKIVVEAGIAEWEPGNGGSSPVVPGT